MVTPDPPADTLVKSPRFFHEHFDGFTGSEQQGNEVEWNEMIAITHTHTSSQTDCAEQQSQGSYVKRASRDAGSLNKQAARILRLRR